MAGTPRRREERKAVTALFADVVGSTALAERLDPEDFRELMDGALAKMIASIEQFGGSVERVMGDGVLALFGAPVAHEDDPERAVLAALRIVEGTQEYAKEIARSRSIDEFAVRVGVETGVAVLGPIGHGEHAEWGATGDALNTASRLQGAARPGSVLVGAATQRLVEPLFDWGEPSELDLKGKAEPVCAYEALWAGRAPDRRFVGPEAPLVGREREIGLLREAVGETHAGRGGILLVFGDAGIGKTRLLHEARVLFDQAPAGERKPLWLHGRCMSYAEAFPYWPFQELLRDWLGARADQADRRAALTAELDRLFPSTAGEVRPFLAALLGPSSTEEDERSKAEADATAEAAMVSGLSREALQHGTVNAVLRLLTRLAEDGPLVLAIDDLHWADASSLALAESLLVLAEEAAVLLVLAARPQRDHASWRVKEVAARELPHRTRELTLTALADEADRQLLVDLAGEGVLPESLERQMLERGDGNPFFIEELVRSLVDSGALKAGKSGLLFDREVRVEVPDSVEKVVLSRLDRLDSSDRRVLDAASVLGREFRLALLEAVAGDGGRVPEAIRELQRLDLLHEGARWPEAQYRFKHSLIQEAAYNSLLRGPRRDLHRRAAEALETPFDDGATAVEESYGLLAHHWRAAGDASKALDFHTLAAKAAARIYAAEEASEQFGAALEAAAALGLTGQDQVVYRLLLERGKLTGSMGYDLSDLEAALEAAVAAGDREAEMEALLQLGTRGRARDVAGAIGLVERALGLAEELGDDATQVLALARLSITDSNRLRFDSALERADRALAVARRVGTDEASAVALDSLKLASLQLGDLDSLERTTTELERIHRQSGDLWYLQYALLESAFVPLADGRWGSAVARAEEALAVSERMGDRAGRILVLDALLWAHRCRGDYGAALRYGGEAVDLATDLELLEWIGWAAASHAWTLVELGAFEEAVSLLERGLESAERASASNQRIRCASLLAWATRVRGDAARSSELLDGGLRLLEQVTAPAGRAWLFGGHAYVALARTLLAAGRPEQAEALAVPLLAAAERAGWKELVSRCSLVVAECRARTGDLPGALEAGSRALEIAHGCELPRASLDANLALAGLERDRGRRDAGDAHAEAAREQAELIAATLDPPTAAAFRSRPLDSSS